MNSAPAAIRPSWQGPCAARPSLGVLLASLTAPQPAVHAAEGRTRVTKAPPRQQPAAGASPCLSPRTTTSTPCWPGRRLLKAGHRVDIVGNGKAASKRSPAAGRKRRYDVVLMDLHVPVMDGLDAIAAIRRYEEEVGVPPVPIMVLCRPTARRRRATRCLAHGASGFVTKAARSGSARAHRRRARGRLIS